MNKKERRLNELVGLLNEQPNLSVRNLAGILNVSEMTIRRDLNFIQSSNRLDNINNIEHEYKLSEERAKYSAEKNRIGKFAVSLISPGDILIITTEPLPEKCPNTFLKTWGLPFFATIIISCPSLYRKMMFPSFFPAAIIIQRIRCLNRRKPIT